MKKCLFIILLIIVGSRMSAQCGPGQVSFSMIIHTDAWPYETYWQLVPEGVGCGNQVIAEGSNLNVGCASTASNNSPEGYAGDAVVNFGPICIDSGSYDLIFIDTYGDGGLTFELYEDGVLMHAFSGAGFGNTLTFSTGVSLIPAYDSPCQALPILVDGPTVTVNNANAMASTGEPAPNGNDCGAFGSWCETGISNSVWLSFVPTANASYEITTCHPETTTDTQIALWKTQNCQDFSTYQLVSSNDDMMGGCNSGGDLYASQMFASCLDTNYQYFIQIDGWNGATGDIEVSVATTSQSVLLDGLVHSITCPLNKGDVGDGMIQPYMFGAGVDFSCQWIGPNGFTSNNWIIDQLEAGDYFLTAITTCGEVFNHLYTIVQPEWWNIAPNVTPTSCSNEPDGGFAPVVTGGTPGYGFQWLGPSGYTSIDPIINNLSAGLYQLTVSDANGCQYSAEYTLQSNDSYVFSLGNDLTLCLNDVVELTGPVGSNLIYYWQDGSTNANYTINAGQWGLGAHSVMLNVVTTAGCFGTDQLDFVVNDCVNVTEEAVADFSIFPNPSFDGSCHFSWKEQSPGRLEIVDLTGRKVKTIFVQSSFSIFDWSELESGSYCILAFNSNGVCIGQKTWILNK